MTTLAAIASAAPEVRKEHRNHHTRDSKKMLRQFSSALVRRREELNMTRRSVADAVEISYSALSHLELGNNWPTLPVYRALCRVLKVGKPPMLR